MLARNGPCAIGDLLTAIPTRLAALLAAFQELEKFHLIEYDAGNHRVSLTAPGSDVATALAADGIRTEARRLFDADPAPAPPP